MYIDLKINDVPAKFLVDTGATISLVSNKIFYALDKSKRSEVRPLGQTSVTANRTNLSSIGQSLSRKYLRSESRGDSLLNIQIHVPTNWWTERLESGVTKVVDQQDEKLVHDSAWLESEVSRRPKRKKKWFAWLRGCTEIVWLFTRFMIIIGLYKIVLMMQTFGIVCIKWYRPKQGI